MEFQNFVAKVELQTNKKVKALRDDKGGEYISNDFDIWVNKQGIICEHTVRATPQQNGVAKRLNRTLAEGVIMMLNQANLSKSFWGTAVLYLTEILNRTPSSATSDTTSWAIWHGKRPDISMFRVFGCQVHVNILRKDRKNLEPHSEPCIFIGFSEGYKGWKVYNPETKKMSVARDVVFDETSFPGLSTKTQPSPIVMPVTLSDIWLDTAAPPPLLPAASDSDDDDEDSDSEDYDEDEDEDVAKQLAPTTPEQRPQPKPEKPARVSTPFKPTTTTSPTPTPKVEDTKSDESDEDNRPIPPLRFPTPPPPSPPTPPKPVFAPAGEAPQKTKAPAIFTPSTSTRPVRSTRNPTDAHILAGGSKHRTTAPVIHRQPSNQGGVRADERGGDQNEIPPPLTQDSINADDDTETVDVTRALRATNIIGSLFDLYDVDYGEVLPLPYASEICLQMAIDKAYGAATRPQDAPDTVS